MRAYLSMPTAKFVRGGEFGGIAHSQDEAIALEPPRHPDFGLTPVHAS